jgi:hypothetical protein
MRSKKGGTEIDTFLYLTFVIIIGLTFVIITTAKINANNSPVGRSLELAAITALHIDSLSSVQEGDLSLSTGDYKYDVEVQKKGGFWRSLGSAVLPSGWVLKSGWYVVVTSKDDTTKKAEPQYFMVNSYDDSLGENYHIMLSNTNKICVKKIASMPLAKLVTCTTK